MLTDHSLVAFVGVKRVLVLQGDLEGFRIHKFKFHKQEYLMAYFIQGPDVVFYMIGAHENFYRELKSYLKEVDK